MPTLSALIIVAVTFVGCEPKEKTLLQQATKLELRGKLDEAADKYAEAASLGNLDAYQKLGDIALRTFENELASLRAEDYLDGYDRWLVEARKCLQRADDCYGRAKGAGCTNRIHVGIEKLKECEKRYSRILENVSQAKEKERQRLATVVQFAKIEAERKVEEIRRRQEAEAQERKRQAEEAAKRESPEYCIEHGLALPPAAFIEVVRDVTFQSDSGNDIADREENRRRWNRFRGKKIVVEGQIRKVEETFSPIRLNA